MDYLPVFEVSRTTTHRSRSVPEAAKGRCSNRRFAERRTLNTFVSCTGHRSGRRAAQVGRVARFEGFIIPSKTSLTAHMSTRAAADGILRPTCRAPLPNIFRRLMPARRRTATKLKGALVPRKLDAPEAFIATSSQPAKSHLCELAAPQDGEIVERQPFTVCAPLWHVLFRMRITRSFVLVDVRGARSFLSSRTKGSVRLRAYPDRVFNGKVALIYPHLDAETRPHDQKSECQIRKKCCGGHVCGVEIATERKLRL